MPLPRILTWYNGSTAMSHANCQLAVVACGMWQLENGGCDSQVNCIRQQKNQAKQNKTRHNTTQHAATCKSVTISLFCHRQQQQQRQQQRRRRHLRPDPIAPIRDPPLANDAKARTRLRLCLAAAVSVSISISSCDFGIVVCPGNSGGDLVS